MLALRPRPGQQGGSRDANYIFCTSSLTWRLLALIVLLPSSFGWKWSPALTTETEAMCCGLQSHLASPGLLDSTLFSWERNKLLASLSHCIFAVLCGSRLSLTCFLTKIINTMYHRRVHWYSEKLRTLPMITQIEIGQVMWKEWYF